MQVRGAAQGVECFANGRVSIRGLAFVCPEHRELKSWFGGKFDPYRFDLDAVNKRLGIKCSPKKATKKAMKKTAKKAAKKKSKPRGTWVFTGKPDEK